MFVPYQEEVSTEVIRTRLDKIHPNFEYRKGQLEIILEALHNIHNTNKKYIVISAGTGTGKSVIAKHIADYYVEHVAGDLDGDPKREALFLTKTIGLQDQYLGDFSDMKKLMGATNYSCHTDHIVPIPPTMKAHGGCKYYIADGMCEYNKARSEYQLSLLKILNYAFFMRGMSRYNTRGLLVCDEAHNLEESLIDILNTEIRIEVLRNEKSDNIIFDNYVPHGSLTSDGLTFNQAESIMKFCFDKVAMLSKAIKELEKSIERMVENDRIPPNLVEVLEKELSPKTTLYNRYHGIGTKLYEYLDTGGNGWTHYYDKTDKLYVFKPVFIPPNIHNMVFNNPRHVLLMSATASRVAKSLRLPPERVHTIEAEYLFDVENRPFYALLSMPRFNARTREEALPEYVEMIDRLISQYGEDGSVLIHCVSYANAEYIKQNSKFGHRILVPTSLEVRDIHSHIEKGTIIASPAMTEGVDLANGVVQAQIFMKVPYPFLGDPWVVKKKDEDDGWYDYCAMLDIIQGSGRMIRGPNDKGDTFMLDPSFSRLYHKCKDQGAVPSWWQSTVHFV